MCLVSIQYTACGHAGSPFILDKDRCHLWPGPQCVFHFKRRLSYNALLISPNFCDQCLGKIHQFQSRLGEDACNNEAKDPEEDEDEGKEQPTDVDTSSTSSIYSTRSLPQEPMLFDSLDSLDSMDTSDLIEAAAATFPAEKNTSALKVTNASVKSDSGSDSTVHGSVASNRKKGVHGAPGIYEQVPGEIDIDPFGFYLEDEPAIYSSIYDHGDREVEDLIEQVLSRWRSGKDSGEDV
ncbi:uncharacterized protein PgNI_09648 [Pyricularia grisea]|uniref:Uncharacterized protein n=1 Tax=Pyricularia grisea TaxID=148305 RepID=A0A6P8ARI2_PYRGI|nr:uncharacterized protein PgNI_09648 [Pyricularia grisea]TLD04739.1 hypothetical protein PgNI_09648 [Pyricularia grisea]